MAFTSVRQEWRHAGVLGIQSELRKTDEDGTVIFPERTFFAPVILRFGAISFDTINNFLMMHGGAKGIHSRVVCPDGSRNWLEYTPEREMKHELVFEKLL